MTLDKGNRYLICLIKSVTIIKMKMKLTKMMKTSFTSYSMMTGVLQKQIILQNLEDKKQSAILGQSVRFTVLHPLNS